MVESIEPPNAKNTPRRYFKFKFEIPPVDFSTRCKAAYELLKDEIGTRFDSGSAMQLASESETAQPLLGDSKPIPSTSYGGASSATAHI